MEGNADAEGPRDSVRRNGERHNAWWTTDIEGAADLQPGSRSRRRGLMSGRTITGSLAGASFTFTCDAADLFEYSAGHLAPLIGPAGSAPAVTATLRWHEGQPPAARPVRTAHERVDRVDRDLYLIGNRLHWFRVDDLRDLHLHFTWTENRLAVEGDFYYRLGNDAVNDRLRRVLTWRRATSLRQRRFTTLLYYLVYYPCWWWLECVQDFHPIHAAGIETAAGVILLAGASGVGKSSLALALAAGSGARLLADSFVLHNGVDVRAVHEPILLDDWSRAWLGARGEILRAIPGRYALQRRGYLVPADRWAASGRAALLVFPRRASAASVTPLPAETARQRLSALDLTINDLRRYFAFAAVLEQVAPRGLVMQREVQLARLTSALPAYDLGLTTATTSAAAVESIQQLLDDPRQRVAGGGG
jgi:hypothetical protein